MTNKDDLQQELKEKVKAGVKPSDIKKLKRSKSTGDIPNPPPPPANLLQDQLTQKQKEIESLRTSLEKVNQELNETKTALDKSLEARTTALREWQTQQEQISALNQELNQTIDQASTELEKGDSEISSLRTKIWTLKSAKEQLERELKRERVRRNSAPGNTPLPSAPLNSPWITPTLTFFLIGITLYLTIR